ncbi:septal ring lytic transglycosylase RlpA family protein [Allochromatium vinosum]|uniref:Endolytic peptidoglycan transglycosylase RlpA n=1 Tax=Allochromatium vinosum (strain ATCC 17899 / DSM 180 / NBRC 103801 / NCIMB 10441 / D) TaxID=572477 RepID=D3RMH9_ALLVD|nr:septal ring lytic transglycosylase RlpA family protein [Allochromatium vinosum]ADC61237.1 rare lipoprotein A [Allochromatium vinosum DSM 180]MBK1655519.1 septal ring lytic transglycosylase RlpA family lipoprotein [Allochromatium vinosum]
MKKTLITAGLLAGLLPFASSATANSGIGHVQKGIASFYHDSLHGRKTASGQVYDKRRLSAAHRTLPLGTKIRVTDTRTGRSVIVRVNDRGPFAKGRIVDLSKEAAKELGIVDRGIARVDLKVLSTPQQGS